MRGTHNGNILEPEHALNWCRRALARVVPITPTRIALFCSVLALASLRCISDFITVPGGAAPAFRLAFVDAPRAGMPGAPIATVRVAVRDAADHEAGDVAATVTIRLVGGPPGATLGGDLTAAVVDGVAAFPGLTVDSAGSFRLAAVADGSGIAPDTSAAFALAWPPVTSLTLRPDDVRLEALGDTVTIGVDARAQDGVALPAPPPLTWTSGDAGVATVDARGLVTARGNGTTAIRARIGDVASTMDVEVRQEVRTVTIDPADVLLSLYQTWVLTATARDPNGHPVTRPPRFEWRSSRSRSVTVSPVSGDPARAVVRRLRSGSATITATMEETSGTAIVR